MHAVGECCGRRGRRICTIYNGIATTPDSNSPMQTLDAVLFFCTRWRSLRARGVNLDSDLHNLAISPVYLLLASIWY